MSVAWVHAGTPVLCFRETSKGVTDRLVSTTIDLVTGNRVTLVGSTVVFQLGNRLSHGLDGEPRAALLRKADGWGGRYLLVPVDHPLAAAAHTAARQP